MGHAVKRESLPADFLQYRKVGPGKYYKYNPVLGIHSTLWILKSASGRAGEVDIHTMHEQDVGEVLDLNVMQQNNHAGFKGQDMYQGTRIPMVEYRKIMKRCGFVPGQGYDQKKFRQILNDSDYSKLRCVPGKI